MAIKLDKTKLVKNLANKYILVPHLDRAIEQGEIEWEFKHEAKKGDDAWHPSGDCTPSLHDLYLKGFHAPKLSGKVTHQPSSNQGFGAGLMKTFMVGHFWHAYLQHIVVEKLGFASWDDIERRGFKGWGEMGSKQSEVRYFEHIKDPILWKPWHWATGSADVCPCEIDNVGRFLIDFKTMGAHDYKRNEAPAWCADKWECQANVYMDWFDVEEAIFVGILKDSPHDMKEFVFKRNQPLIDAIYAKWELVSQCITEGIEPPAEETFPLPIKGPAS